MFTIISHHNTLLIDFHLFVHKLPKVLYSVSVDPSIEIEIETSLVRKRVGSH